MPDSRPRGRGFEPYRRHYVVSLSKNINPSLVLVQPRKARPFITERLLIGRKESNKQTYHIIYNPYNGGKLLCTFPVIAVAVVVVVKVLVVVVVEYV